MLALVAKEKMPLLFSMRRIASALIGYTGT